MYAALRQRILAATSGLSRHFWTLWWGLLVNRIASFVVAFLAIFLVRDRGFTPAAAGRVLAIYGLGTVVAGPLGGLLADRVGRRATMLAGLFFGALTVGALAVVRDPAALALLAFLAAATGDVYRPAMTAAVADLVPPADRARAYGLVYWAVNLGLSIGLVLAGLFAERNLALLFVADAATSLAFAVALFLWIPETRPAGAVHEPALAGMAKVFTDRAYVSFLVLHVLALLVFTQWQLALPLDMAAHGLGASAYSFLMGVNCLGVVLLQPLLTPQIAKVDAARLLAASALLFGAGFGVNALGGGLPVYAVGTFLWTVGEVVGFPVASAVVADLAPVALRGRYQGAFSMCWGAALTLSPLAAGEVLHRLGAQALWLLCVVLAIGVAAGHLLTGGSRRGRLAVAAENVRSGGSSPDALRTGDSATPAPEGPA